jgi:hypothetical protein
MTMTKPTSEQVTYNSPGLNAVSRTLLSRVGETISVKDFGAVGDGVADDTAAIQAAIDWAMYRNLPYNTSRTWNVPSVFIPAGRYKISDTIHLGYGDTFRSVHLRGDGRMFVGEQGFAGTTLVPTFNDRPAIAVSGGRSNSIQGLSIRGLNQSWVINNRLGDFTTPLLDDLVAANWVNSSFPASASSRYAPYAGIAIDPYAGPRPAVSYPDVNYPSWLNYTTQYNSPTYSSDVTIRDVEITGFAVALVVQPCDADGNGDFVKIENALVGYCQYGVSIGNTQARDCSINNVSMAQCYCFVTTSVHGRQNGKPGIDCRNSSFNFGIYGAIIPNMAFGGNIAFRNMYAECLYSIGLFGGSGGARQQNVLFSECEFGFQSWRYRGISSEIISAGCPITFDGCTFSTYGFSPSADMPNIIRLNCDARQTSVKNCYLLVGEEPTKLYEKQAINSTNGIVFSGLGTNLVDWSIRQSGLYDMTTGNVIPGANTIYHSSQFSFSRQTCIPVYAKHLYGEDWDYGIPFPRTQTLFGKTTITSISQSGRTVTADLTGNRTALSLATIGGDVGDVIEDSTTGTVFIVSSRTGTTIEMVAQNNLDTSGNLAVTITTSSGNFSYLMCRAFALASLHYGDISSSSATISNVVGADGSSRSVNSATFGVQANDYAMTGNGNAIGVASPTNSLISSVTSNSIVLSGNARYTATRERLTYFIKQATANNT